MYARNRKLVFCFGPYRFDRETYELTKNGIPLKIQSKPILVLQLLLERHGDIISREELRKALWQENVFVDFEKNLNTAVNKLRAALCDSPASPRYIERVPRIGYRFLAPVQIISLEARTRAAQAGDPDTIVRATETTLDVEVKDPPARHHRREVPWISFVATVSLVLFVLLGTFSSRLRRVEATEPRAAEQRLSVVVAHFSNATREPAFDSLLEQALAIDLQQLPSVDVVSDTRLKAARLTPGTSSAHTKIPSVANEICSRTRSDSVVQGDISNLGSAYVLSLDASTCSGDPIAQEQVQVDRKEDVLAALREEVTSMRSKLQKPTRRTNTGDALSSR